MQNRTTSQAPVTSWGADKVRAARLFFLFSRNLKTLMKGKTRPRGWMVERRRRAQKKPFDKRLKQFFMCRSRRRSELLPPRSERALKVDGMGSIFTLLFVSISLSRRFFLHLLSSPPPPPPPTPHSAALSVLASFLLFSSLMEKHLI